MRISDWSSDVCSSDLCWATRWICLVTPRCMHSHCTCCIVAPAPEQRRRFSKAGSCCFLLLSSLLTPCERVSWGWCPRDRKRVVEGKIVAVRVDLGGLRIIKKKKKKTHHKSNTK